MFQGIRVVFSLVVAAWPAFAAGLSCPQAASGAVPNEKSAQPPFPGDWLVIDPIDGRGRRPLRPDAVVERHLVPADAAPPVEGAELVGERDKASWRAVEAGEGGRVDGRHGWAYAALQSPHRRVVLARLSGAGTLIVNGRGVSGDIYSYGWGGLPCLLEQGVNDVYVNGIRGGFQLTFEPVSAGLIFAPWSVTLPDLVVGEEPFGELGVSVLNATEDWVGRVEVELGGDGLFLRTRAVLEEGLAPLAVRRVALRLAPAEAGSRLGEAGEVALELTLRGAGEQTVQPVTLRVREPRALRKRTYRSKVDGSVQELAVLPPSEGEPGGPMRLLLSLHGAGVHAPNQAGSYGAKPDFWHVAPTNRSRYGFDWQDWGRVDAYDALEVALRESGVDRRRVYLSGHSMGGHGVWHLAANDPDGFAAIAPSAAWQSFDTYGGRPDGALVDLWHRADAPSRTVDLVSNLAGLPTSILHGADDDNVSAEEGRQMHRLLVEAGASPDLHLEPGKGHWWDGPAGAGADCLDWPAFFELFRATEIERDPESIEFTTVDPGTDARHHWVRVVQVIEAGRPARVRGRLEESNKRVSLETENVRRLELLGPAAAASSVVADGVELEVAVGEQLLRQGEAWAAARPAGAGEKRPLRMGPLKRGFDRRFVLVVPTEGSAEEDRAALQRAVHDASVWWYRANGDAPIVRDTDWLAFGPRYRGRNVVLYGNADTNLAWEFAVDERCPIDVRRGSVELGGRRLEGDALDALFVFPRRGESDTLVVGLASTGPAADRRSCTLALFVSGVGYPDYAVVGPAVLTQGDDGVAQAGFFGPDWTLD